MQQPGIFHLFVVQLHGLLTDAPQHVSLGSVGQVSVEAVSCIQPQAGYADQYGKKRNIPAGCREISLYDQIDNPSRIIQLDIWKCSFQKGLHHGKREQAPFCLMDLDERSYAAAVMRNWYGCVTHPGRPPDSRMLGFHTFWYTLHFWQAAVYGYLLR